MSLVYVDKLIEIKNLILTSLNVHRLLVTCVMVAAKFHDDLFYNNAYFSKLGKHLFRIHFIYIHIDCAYYIHV